VIRTATLNLKNTSPWGYIGVIGGILVFIGVFTPWIDILGLAYITGIQAGILALSSDLFEVQFLIGNIVFIFLFGIIGLVTLFMTRYKVAMVFGILAVAFCTLDLILYLLALGGMISIGPFLTMAGAVMLTEGAYKLGKGASSRSLQNIITENSAQGYYGYGSNAATGSTPTSFPNYANQNLYGSGAPPVQQAYNPNAQYPQQDQRYPPGGPL
jgi:hypothetical protein